MAKDVNEKGMSRAAKRDLAEVLLSMTYGELISAAESLANIKRSRLETREDFASLLHDWAETQ